MSRRDDLSQQARGSENDYDLIGRIGIAQKQILLYGAVVGEGRGQRCIYWPALSALLCVNNAIDLSKN